LILDQPAQLASVRRGEKRLAPRVTMTWGNIPGFFVLGQELFHHTEANTIAVGDLLAGKFAFPATGQNPLPQIQGKCLSHGTAVYHQSIVKATVLFKMLCYGDGQGFGLGFHGKKKILGLKEGRSPADHRVKARG
jgi:hypothetical protein